MDAAVPSIGSSEDDAALSPTFVLGVSVVVRKRDFTAPQTRNVQPFEARRLSHDAFLDSQ